MSWLATTAIVTAAASSYALALRGVNGRRRAGEPPLVRGPVPQLGAALSFGRDPPRFLAACRARHGDVFTLFIAGRRMTFVLDPLSYVAVLKAPQLRFAPVEDEALARGFGLPDARARVDIATLAGFDHSYLKGQHLAPVTARMETRLRAGMLAAASDEWSSVELYELLWRLLFEAGTDALFGDEVRDEQLAAAFIEFDRAFPLLIAGLPSFLTKRGRAALDHVCERLAGVGAEGSAWMSRRAELLARVDPMISGRLNSSLIWAATANTVPTAFWTVFYLLTHPRALAAVVAELHEVVGPAGAELPALPSATLDRLRILDSAVREAMRLASATSTVRDVVESFEFEAPCGTWSLRAGDRVCLFPYLMHRDPEIHPEPERYVYDRFHAEVGIKRFRKRGQPVAIPLMPFGGGQSMCPGRFFAINEMKLLVALTLYAYEIELDDPRDPGFEISRAMLGILPPAREVPARIRRRRPGTQLSPSSRPRD